LLIGVAILALLIKLLKVNSWDRILHFNWIYMVGAALASFGANISGTLRWRYSLDAVQTEDGLHFLELLKIYMQGTILGFAFVGGGASIAYQALALKSQKEVRLTKVALSLLIDRILDPLLSILILAAASLQIIGIISLEEFNIILLLLAGTIIVISVFGGSQFKFLLLFFLSTAERVQRKVRHAVSKVFSQRETKQIDNPQVKDLHNYKFSPAYLITLTLARMIFLLLRLELMAYAFGFMVPIEIILIGLVVFQLSWLISVTPGGLGIAEWGWVAVLIHYGYGSSAAVFLSLAFRIYLIVFTLLVLSMVYLITVMRKEEERPRLIRY
jgi:uncharacterized protein (TIRG00374 family)